MDSNSSAPPSAPIRTGARRWLSLRYLWLWIGLLAWGIFFGIHLVRTYTYHELLLGLPTIATFFTIWLWMAKKGTRAARITVTVATLVSWLVVGTHGMGALSASRSFRHFPAEQVQQLTVYAVRYTDIRMEQKQLFALIDPVVIQRIVKTFETAHPCWNRAPETTEHYLIMLHSKRGLDTPLPFTIEMTPQGRAARVQIQWKGLTGAVSGSEYRSRQLYEELQRAGLK